MHTLTHIARTNYMICYSFILVFPYTHPLRRYVQGAWPEYNDGSSINSVHRSSDGTMLAAADDTGRVKVFRYPCLAKGSQYVSCVGHNHAVANARFNSDSSFMVTVGQKDRSVLVWKVTRPMDINGNRKGGGGGDSEETKS